MRDRDFEIVSHRHGRDRGGVMAGQRMPWSMHQLDAEVFLEQRVADDRALRSFRDYGAQKWRACFVRLGASTTTEVS